MNPSWLNIASVLPRLKWAGWMSSLVNDKHCLLVELFFALSPENLNLLTELASLGEDFYVRGYALLGLRLSGLLLAGSIIKRVLEAEEAFERNAAKSAMLRLGHCIGDSGLRLIFIGERNECQIATLERLIERIGEVERASGRKRKPKPTKAIRNE